jgi:hypothetical protein
LPALQSRRPGCSRLLHQQARLSKKSLRRQVGILHFGGGSVDRLRDAHPEKNEGSKSSAKVKNPSKINVVSPLGVRPASDIKALPSHTTDKATTDRKEQLATVTHPGSACRGRRRGMSVYKPQGCRCRTTDTLADTTTTEPAQ